MTEENNPAVSAEDLELINRYSRRQLKAEEVYVFPVVLCDNETDRDCERFSIPALKTLAELYVGKTGIFDHEAKGSNQTARIFSAETVSDPERRTRSGEVYSCVRAKAYLMRTEKTADLIAEIDGGIKKEVSVCCSVKKKRCSICGADMMHSPCSHVKGAEYNGGICEVVLEEPTDAYEWSFVAVPAQPNAGITKSFGGEDAAIAVKALRRELDKARGELSRAKRDIQAEIVRLGQFCVPAYSAETVKTMCGGMTLGQLLDFKEKTRGLAEPEKPVSVLYGGEGEDDAIGRFKLKR